MAFTINMDPQEAQKTFLGADELVFRRSNTWIPVEITVINDGFIKARQIGAQEWREIVAKNKEGFYPMYNQHAAGLED